MNHDLDWVSKEGTKAGKSGNRPTVLVSDTVVYLVRKYTVDINTNLYFCIEDMKNSCFHSLSLKFV